MHSRAQPVLVAHYFLRAPPRSATTPAWPGTGRPASARIAGYAVDPAAWRSGWAGGPQQHRRFVDRFVAASCVCHDVRAREPLSEDLIIFCGEETIFQLSDASAGSRCPRKIRTRSSAERPDGSAT
jgi:hypothetical protein